MVISCSYAEKEPVEIDYEILSDLKLALHTLLEYIEELKRNNPKIA